MGDKIVWSDRSGDMRKKNQAADRKEHEVSESQLLLKLRRLTSGKGRAVIEISGLPKNKEWCLQLTSELKKKIGVGGAYKMSYIEIHGEKFEEVASHLTSLKINWKKVGG